STLLSSSSVSATEMSAPAKRSSNEASFWSKRKRSPKEAWRLVDTGGSDSSTAGSKANSVSKLGTRTSDGRGSSHVGRMVSKTEKSADSARSPALVAPTKCRPTDSSNEASFWSKRKRSPKEPWRLVDAGGSDSSAADSKANPVP